MPFGRKNLKFFLSLCLRIQKEALWRFALLLSIGDGNAVWLKNSKKIFAAMVQLHISGELLSQHLKKLVPAIGIGATRNPQFSRDLMFAFSLHNSLTDELVFRLKPSDYLNGVKLEVKRVLAYAIVLYRRIKGCFQRMLVVADGAVGCAPISHA